MITIYVFTLPGCLACTILKSSLNRENVSFIDVDITINKDLWNYIRNQGVSDFLPAIFQYTVLQAKIRFCCVLCTKPQPAMPANQLPTVFLTTKQRFQVIKHLLCLLPSGSFQAPTIRAATECRMFPLHFMT